MGTIKTESITEKHGGLWHDFGVWVCRNGIDRRDDRRAQTDIFRKAVENFDQDHFGCHQPSLAQFTRCRERYRMKLIARVEQSDPVVGVGKYRSYQWVSPLE